jgi:hypothetical protein
MLWAESSGNINSTCLQKMDKLFGTQSAFVDEKW